MDESRFIKMININPTLIENIKNPTDEMKLLAVRKNGLVIKYIENPTKEMQEIAISKNAGDRIYRKSKWGHNAKSC